MVSFFEVPKGVLKKLDYYHSRFFSQCDKHKKKYRLTKWSIVCRPKEFGGLGVQNLKIQNTSKWIFKLINEEGTWQDLRRKYLSNKTLTQATKKPSDSHFWAGLMKIKDQFLQCGHFKINSGSEIRFWEDTWIGDRTFGITYPNLYNLARKKDASMAQLMNSTPYNVSFRRGLVGNNLQAWHDLVATIVTTSLNGNSDVFVWDLHSSGTFSVKSIYKALIQDGIEPLNCPIWKINVPLKINIFLWYLIRGVTLTKDDLAKRNWQGSLNCCYCSD